MHRNTEQFDHENLVQVLQQIDFLRNENELLISFLQRHNSLDADEENDQQSAAPLSRARTKKARDRPQSLTWNQKHDIAADEATKLTEQIKNLETDTQTRISTLKASIEEIELEINETKKDAFEFRRDVVDHYENVQIKSMSAEKVEKYFHSKNEAKRALIRKIQAKNEALEKNIEKLQKQLLNKENEGDAHHSIDLHQLQIENNQYSLKIQDRNKELNDLKKKHGTINQVLQAAKDELTTLITESAQLARDRDDRENSIDRVNDELGKVQDEIDAARKINLKYIRQQPNPDMPQVLDYVNQKSAEYDLKMQIKNWERKVEIAEMGAKRARQFLRL